MTKIPGRPQEYIRWTTVSGNPDASVEEFSDFLVSANFWSKWAENFSALDTDEAVNRALAVAKYEALERSYAIKDLPERSTTRMLMDAKRSGWHRYLPAEYESMGDLLSGIVDRMSEDNESSRRDLQFAIDDFFPALSRAGVDVNKILEMPKKWSKCRVAIPYVRTALDELEGEKLADFLKELVDVIVDDDVTVREMRSSLSGNGHKEHPTIEGELYQLSADKFIYIAVVTNDGANFLAKVLGFSIIDILKPFSKFKDFLKGLVR